MVSIVNEEKFYLKKKKGGYHCLKKSIIKLYMQLDSI